MSISFMEQDVSDDLLRECPIRHFFAQKIIKSPKYHLYLQCLSEPESPNGIGGIDTYT